MITIELFYIHIPNILFLLSSIKIRHLTAERLFDNEVV